MYNILIMNTQDNTFEIICCAENEEALIEISTSLENILPSYLQVDFQMVECDSEV